MKKINIIVITEISNKRTNYEVSLLDDALKKIVGPQEWWKSCRKKPKITRHCQLFLRLLTGCRLHVRDDSQYKCCLCEIEVKDKAGHFLFTCTHLQQRHDNEWQYIDNAMPPAMAKEMDGMDDIFKV